MRDIYIGRLWVTGPLKPGRDWWEIRLRGNPLEQKVNGEWRIRKISTEEEAVATAEQVNKKLEELDRSETH